MPRRQSLTGYQQPPDQTPKMGSSAGSGILAEDLGDRLAALRAGGLTAFGNDVQATTISQSRSCDCPSHAKLSFWANALIGSRPQARGAGVLAMPLDWPESRIREAGRPVYLSRPLAACRLRPRQAVQGRGHSLWRALRAPSGRRC